MIPLGSLTADHEIANGTVTEAPFAGATSAGAGGPEGRGGVGVGVGFPWRADVGCDDTPTTSIVRAKMSESVIMRDLLTTKLQSMYN
jgi:hypothetical protein